jgi:hypothetical protein
MLLGNLIFNEIIRRPSKVLPLDATRGQATEEAG